MPENLSDILSNSTDPRKLVEAALTLAHNDRPEDHQKLLGYLRSESFLLRMDSAEDYRGLAARLRIRRVLDELSRSKSGVGHTTLVSLTQDPVFIGESARVDLLITACASIRPAPPEVIKFWSAHCLPEDGYCNLTIEAAVGNGSPPAVGLVSSKLADSAFEEEDRVNWMRTSILTHRNDGPLLSACEALLKQPLSPTLRVALVEVLFDYKPSEWFMPATVLEPPPRLQLGPESRATLQRIAEFAPGNIPISPDLAAKVKATLETLRKMESHR